MVCGDTCSLNGIDFLNGLDVITCNVLFSISRF